MSKTHDQIVNELDNTRPRPIEPPKETTVPDPRAKEVQETVTKIMQNRRRKIGVDVGAVAAQLGVGKPNPTFPEPLFVEHFLPMFAGNVPETNEVNYGTWIEKIAGNDMQAVDIINETGVLFTVPPLMEHSALEMAKPGGESITLIERNYRRLQEFDVSVSQAYLEKKLVGLHVKGTAPQELYDNLRAWNDIFKRYGLEDKIINLGKLQDADPNKDKPSSIVAPSSDLTGYELDTD